MISWIKMRVNLDTDPRVFAISDITGQDPLRIVGMLFKIWAWADTHSIDGNALGVTDVTLDGFVDCVGFSEALRAVGWLEGHGRDLSFPRFEEHNGQTAKRRAETQARVAKCRNAKAGKDVTQPPLPEKRREDKSIQPSKQRNENEKVFNPFESNPEFCEVASQYLKTRTAKHGRAAQTTVEAWYYDLARFPVSEAIEILRFSTAAEAKRPITNGDHAKARPSPTGAAFAPRGLNRKPVSNDDLLSKII